MIVYSFKTYYLWETMLKYYRNVVEKVQSDKRLEIWSVKTVLKSHEKNIPEYARLLFMFVLFKIVLSYQFDSDHSAGEHGGWLEYLILNIVQGKVNRLESNR